MTEEQLLEIERSLDLEAKMHGLTGLGNAFVFFYDETNNNRKLHIKEDGTLNVPGLGDFVLGGIVCDSTSEKLDFESFRSTLRLDSEIKEIKLKTLAKGEFLDIISNERIFKFLNWIEDQDLLIHYFHLDPLYWSVVDIIDSVLLHKPELTQHVFRLKADLYEVIKPDLAGVIEIFSKYNYPDVRSESIKPFTEELLERIEPNRLSVPDFNFKMLKYVLTFARGLPNLEFIEGYCAKKLIEKFDIFYLHRLLRFKNSVHVFDNEPQVVGGLLGSPAVRDKFKNNLEFVESEASFEIQVSDVLTGILGKMHTFLRTASIDEVARTRRSVGSIGRSSLHSLNSIFTASQAECSAFFQHVASVRDLHKEKVLLGIEDPR